MTALVMVKTPDSRTYVRCDSVCCVETDVQDRFTLTKRRRARSRPAARGLCRVNIGSYWAGKRGCCIRGRRRDKDSLFSRR